MTKDKSTNNNSISRSESGIFSVFKAPIKNTSPYKEINISDVYKVIVSDKNKAVTDTLRSYTDRKAARNFKAEYFDYVTFSGTFTHREDAALINP